MKNAKVLFLAAMFVAFAATGFGDTPTKESPEAYQKEKIDINRDVAQIHAQKSNIKSLKAQLRKDCKANRTTAVVVDRKELRKDRKELRKDVKNPIMGIESVTEHIPIQRVSKKKIPLKNDRAFLFKLKNLWLPFGSVD